MIRTTSRAKAALTALALCVSGAAALTTTPPVAQAQASAEQAISDPVFYALEQGTIASANGTTRDDPTRIRSAGRAPVDPSWRWLQFEGDTDIDVTIFAYDAGGTYLSPSTGWQNLGTGPYLYAVPAGTATIAYVIKYQSGAPITPADRNPWLQVSAVPDNPPVDDSHVFPYSDTALTLVNHRGLSPGYPENTLVAFANAVERGVGAIEIDLRPTSDGHVIILHDDTVDRTTDGTGAAGSMTLAQIKALDAGSYVGPQFAGERVPTYEEVLQAMQGTGVKLLLDMKSDAIVPEVVHLTEQYGMVDQVIVGPRSVAALNGFKALNPGLRTLGFIGAQADADAFVAAGVDIIRLTPEWIAADVASPACRADYAERVAAYDAGERAHPGAKSCAIERLNRMGVPVWTTTYGAGYEDMDVVLRSGSVGLLSDVPDVLAQLLADIEASRIAEGQARIAALAADVAALPASAAGAVTALAATADHLVAGDLGAACSSLTDARTALQSAGLNADTVAPLVIGLDRVRSVLACSRFGSDEPGTPNDQTLEVTVPEAPSGEFVWSVDGSNDLVNLGTAALAGDHYTATGSINPIRVTDTRSSGPEWSVSAQLSDFATDAEAVSGRYLGWSPQLVEPGAGAVAGEPVASGFDGGDGLSVSSTLGAADAGHVPGSVLLGADLELKLPLDVTAGTYQATLTVTALS